MATVLQQGRMNIRTSSTLDVIAGVWLILAPFVLGYAFATGALWNDILLGIIIAVLAGYRAMSEGYKTSWPSWVGFIAGLWLIVAPFIVGYSSISAAVWNDVIFGIIVAVLSLWAALSTPSESVGDEQR
jgi:ABC-type iron transport system FetAB permease component